MSATFHDTGAQHPIAQALQGVTRLREAQHAQAGLAEAVTQLKDFQARRFAGTYADLLAEGGTSAEAARFFLEELYSARDYRERDAQFARIAGTVEAIFPASVADTARLLADLHLLTETLDDAVARAWLGQSRGEPVRGGAAIDAEAYVRAWRAADAGPARRQQLAYVLRLGDDLARHTQTRGLRLLLRAMRGPAALAGLGALQHFLERGFDTFGELARRRGALDHFMGAIREREGAWIERLDHAPLPECATLLRQTLARAPRDAVPAPAAISSAIAPASPENP